MKRTLQGLFFLLLFILVIGRSAAASSCSIELVDFERQSAKLAELFPVPKRIDALLWHDSLSNNDLKKFLSQVPCNLSSTELKKLLFYCAATKRYERMIFYLEADRLTIILEPCMILERCAIEGQPYSGQVIQHEYLLKPGMPFDAQFHKHAVIDLKQSYKKKGFLDVAVQDQLQENETRKTIQVQLELHKGKHYPLAGTTSDSSQEPTIIFEGNKSFSTQQLIQLVALYGATLEHIPQEIAAEAIQEWYHKHGYINAQVTARKNNNTWLITINEGVSQKKVKAASAQTVSRAQPTQFGQTVLQSSSRVPDEYISREIRYSAGQPYQGQAVADTIARLNRLQIFDRMQLYPIQTPFAHDEYTMMLQIRDDEPRELRTRAGISLQQMSKEFSFKNISYSAGGTFLLKNPTNHADLFFIDADYTYGEQILSANYQYPWIGRLPLDARFQMYATQYLQPGLQHNHKNIYSFVQQGALMGLQYQQGNWDAQINYGIELMETKLKNCQDHPLFCQELSRALNYCPELLDKKIAYLFTEPSAILDRLDDQLNPSKGTLTAITAKVMIPTKCLGVRSSFLKMLFDHAYFVPFSKAILAIRARFGHIFFHRFEQIMPAERFYLGGANSIRSYDTDLCPPLGIIFDDQAQPRFVPQGAQSMVALNVELRIPAKWSLWFAVFQDFGALSNNRFADIKAKHILAGTGAGIRIQTPIGPLRFDFAFKWHRPDPAIAPCCWFLSFGNAF
ncbi:hypothetical protein BH09DEP1_BH09DEP1_3520 [soil metagenome]